MVLFRNPSRLGDKGGNLIPRHRDVLGDLGRVEPVAGRGKGLSRLPGALPPS